jgi:hypothetical protein
MAKVIGTIDLTPDRSQQARTTAYILSSHLKGSAYRSDLFGDFWHYTTVQEDAIFGTWNALEKVHATYRLAGLDFWQDAPKAHKAKLIASVHAGVLEQLTKEGN